MYNHYLAAAQADAPPLHTQTSAPPPSSVTASALSGLTRGLAGRFQNLRLDADTIIVLALAWFLLKDNDDVDWEQLLLTGALLLMGI